jgi:serine/threonine protein kinase
MAAPHPTPADLAAFAVGKLSDADAVGIAGHLADCHACRQVAESAPGDSFVARVKDARPRAAAVLPAELPPELASHPRYRILRELGRGGMGVVYQARQTVMDRQVVIKVINKALVEHPAALERFRREARAAARLSHPNIVTAYDAEQAGDLQLLVMEFVPGKSLAEVLQQQGPLPVARACDCARQAALGLQHAFEQGMVHRDVKPQNLMLTPQDQVKILDFGLAKLASEAAPGKGLTADNAYMGTPDYSAPEQAQDARSADIRADLYSLGCTLYCLLAGRPPFQEETAVQTILAHLQKEPIPLPEVRPDVPPELWDVVTRLLAKDPERRYQTPAEVAQVLAPFGAGPAPALEPAAPSAPFPAPATVAGADTSRLPVVPLARSAAPAGGPTVAAPRSQRRWPGPGVGVAALLVLAAGGWCLGEVILRAKTPRGTLVLEVSDPDAEIRVDGTRWEVRVAGEREPIRIDLDEGPHQLKVTKGNVVVLSEKVTITAGKAAHVKARLVPPELPAGKPAPADRAPARPEPGDRPLFNGKDLGGWVFNGPDTRAWQVSGDELVGSGTGPAPDQTWLLTDRDYTDFVLRFQFRLFRGTNSGVALRAVPGEFVSTRKSREHRHLEVNVQDDRAPSPPLTGALYWSVNGSVYLPPDRHARLGPADSWNDMEVELRGTGLRVSVNGDEVQRTDLRRFGDQHGAFAAVKRSSGRVGFQSYVGQIRLRDVRIQELKEAAAKGP